MTQAPWNISDRPINIALVGCGRISKNHFESITKNDSFNLVGVCDDDPKALDAAVNAYGVDAYRDLTQLLQSCNADMVALCTPSGLHARQTIQIARAGRHVVTEKPMATRWQDGVDMVNACDDFGVRLFVVQQNRRNATLQLLKQAIEQGRFGKIYLANVNVFWTRPQEYYDHARWRGTWEFDGGAFMNQASHYVDLLHWLLGPVESVYAMMGTLARAIEAEDSGVMNIRWRSGTLGSLNVTMLTYPKNLEGSITLLGEKGSVRIGGVAVNEIQHWEFEEARVEDDAIKAANYQTNSVYGFGHPLYYQNVAEVMQGKAQPETDGRDALRTLEILIAAYRSARDEVKMSLPISL